MNTSETMKRNREEHQMAFLQPWKYNCVAHASPEAAQPSAFLCPHIHSCAAGTSATEQPVSSQEWRERSANVMHARSPLVPCGTSNVAHSDRRDSVPGRISLFFPPALIEVVRGDTGSRTHFFFQVHILLSWQRQNHFYESVSGEEVGYELHETVSVRVIRSPSTAHSVAHSTVCGFSSQWNEEDDTGLSTNPANLSMNEEEEGEDSCYHYKRSLTSRCKTAPDINLSQFANSGNAKCIGNNTGDLIMDCLLMTAAEEAALVDVQRWVFLFQGRHMASECGRRMLLSQLLRTPFSCSPDEVPQLSICAFRKY